jgi:hypothetical protein
VIEPIDDDERDQLLRELLLERFGPKPRRGRDDTPQVLARRRRVLCGLDERGKA